MEQVTKETTKKMVVELSPDEVAVLGMRLADKEIEYNKLEAEFTSVKSDYNAKLKTIAAEIKTLAQETHDHKAERDVAVLEIYDEERQMVEVRTVSNNELVGTRDFTMQEKGERVNKNQLGLNLDSDTLPGGEPADEDGDDEDDDEQIEAAAPTDPSELAAEDVETGDAPAEAKAAETNGTPKNPRRRVPRDLPPEDGAA